jgi:hypothetical protein
MNPVFANQKKEGSIFCLTTREIVDAQEHNPQLKTQADKKGYSTPFVKNITVLCKGSKMVIPKRLGTTTTYSTLGPNVLKKLFVF